MMDPVKPSERLNEMMTVVMTRIEDDPASLSRQQQDLTVAASTQLTSDHRHELGQLGARVTNQSEDNSWPLLRLINETFVSLPISRCIDLVTATPTTTTRDQRLCMINWTRSKITTLSLTTANQDQDQDQELKPESGSNFSVLQELLDQHPERTGNDTLARLVYLSSSSLLSLVGIFTNLLILLIIVVNTKQKCQHFLSRTSHTTSHTNYHYVLLFQLTLTGLLLGGYVLFSTSSQLYLATTTRITRSTEEQNCNDHLHHSPMWSPMSIYLPHMSAPISHMPAPEGLPASSWAILGAEIEDSNSEQYNDDLDQQQANNNNSINNNNNNINRTKMIEEQRTQDGRVVITPVRCCEEIISATSSSDLKVQEILLDLVASIHLWTVAALAYDRYCAIAYPLEYLRSINAARAKTFLIILWSGALLTNVFSPLALDRWLQYATERRLNITHLPPTTNSQQLKCFLGNDDDDDHAGTGDTATTWAIASLPLCLSCLTFILVILVPLVCVTICNVSIYGIVKVHERRLSASSGSQSSSGGGGAGGSSGPGCTNLGAMASVASKLRLIEPTLPFYHSNNNNNKEQSADKNADDTSSLASSILGKLIRSSAQVGSLGGAHADRRDSHETTTGRSASSDDDDDEVSPEICNLTGATAADGDGESSSSCKSPSERRELDGISVSVSAGGHQAPMNSTIVNRSRRLVSLNKLGLTKSKRQPRQQHDDVKAEAAVAESRIRFLRRSKRKLKRKLSDKEPSLPAAGLNRSVSRRGSSSFAPSSWAEKTLLLGNGGNNQQQAQDCFCQADNRSLCNGGCSAGVRLLSRNNSRQLDSDGILRQIKMAGLSFAGVAINELMQPVAPGQMRTPIRRATLNRSSSCSLGNLTGNNCVVMNLTNNATCCQCDQQRPPVLSGPNMKDSFVSLNMRDDTPGSGQDKYLTRLHQSELHPTSSQNSASTRSHTVTSCQQHFNFGGTKSIAFNVVVWLILILLLCSLPQYCLVLIDSSRRLYYGQLNVVSLLKDLLQTRLGSTTPQDNVEQPVWLAYTCRLLFLTMLPLNAWLYGIRSRSLKTTLRMVLRRYISKRQASIEINQRRKSNLSTRSRDSSLMSCRTNSRNSSLFCHANNHQQATEPHNFQNHHHPQPHPQQLGCINGRVFRRCASFNLPSTVNQHVVGHQQHTICHHHHHHQCILANDTTAAPTTKQPDQQSQRSHTNSIRFVLGGDDNAPAPRASDDPKTPLLPSPNAGQQCMLSIPSQSVASSQNSISLNSSLAGSNRSLLSASILSSHSAALLLVNNRPKQDGECNNTTGQPAPGSAHPLPANKPLTSVLKKRDSRGSMIRHQDSYDSACSSASQKSAATAGARSRMRPTLERVQSSPGKLLIGVVRPRSLIDGRQEQNDAATQPCASLILSPPGAATKQRKQMVRQRAQDESPQSVKGGQIWGDDHGDHPSQSTHINERRPSSDIRLLLTSAGDENSGEPSNARGGDDDGTNTTDLLLIGDTDYCCELPNEDCEHSQSIIGTGNGGGGGAEEITRSKLDENNQNNNNPDASRFQLEYFKQIKDAVGKYFASRKADKQRAAGRKDSDSSQFSFVSGHSADGVEPQFQSLVATSDDSTTATSMRSATYAGAKVPLRKNSLDSQVVWHHNKTHHHLLGHTHLHHHNFRRCSTTTASSAVNGTVPLSASGSSSAIKTSSSIDSITSDGHSQVANGRHVAQQNSHLRPPTSLKLLLDPDNQQATLYASSLALSPIKETSSYASSNSSLNNQQPQPQQPMAQ